MSNCSCSTTTLLNNGALFESGTYHCVVCNQIIPIARIWRFKVKQDEVSESNIVRLFPKDEPRKIINRTSTSKTISSSNNSWQQSAKIADRAALAVSNYVLIVNLIAYISIAIIAIVLLIAAAKTSIVLIVGLLPLVLLAALQFIWGQSIYMVTEYIRFKTKKAIAED